MNRKERERLARLRPAIIKAIVKLERQYGESALSGAYNRHKAIRATQRRLRAQRVAAVAQIRKLRGS